MSKIFFISDTHFFHKKILKYSRRPFDSIEEMNNFMMEAWNNKVSEDDFIYILGDFALGNPSEVVTLLQKLNGKKHMIIGNHDRRVLKDDRFLKELVWAKNYYKLSVNLSSGLSRKIVLMHYPIIEWDGFFRNDWHLYGHVHGTMKDIDNKSFNVSADKLNYEPISLLELESKMSLKSNNTDKEGNKKLTTIVLK